MTNCMDIGDTLTGKVPQHLNSTGCRIGFSEGKGRGVFASRQIEAHAVIEISPVLLFSPAEYQEHGRHTILDHYTFKWRDGKMALALGLGSLFNHSANPNVSYTIDPLTDSIRYTTTRIVNSGEELCIFYGHNLWFQTPDNVPQIVSNEGNDAWGGLSTLEIETTVLMEEISRYASGDPDDSIPEDELPFTRLKLTSESTDEEEEQVDAIRTGELLPCSWELSQ